MPRFPYLLEISISTEKSQAQQISIARQSITALLALLKTDFQFQAIKLNKPANTSNIKNRFRILQQQKNNNNHCYNVMFFFFKFKTAVRRSTLRKYVLYTPLAGCPYISRGKIVLIYPRTIRRFGIIFTRGRQEGTMRSIGPPGLFGKYIKN